MIGDECPGKAIGCGFSEQAAEPAHEISAIFVIQEDLGALDAAHHDMLQYTGDVESGLSCHEEKVNKNLYLKQ